jgi:hypothetical protein
MSNEVISSVGLKGCMKPQSYLSAISLGLGGYAIFLLSGLVVLVLTRVRQKLGIDHFQFDLFCVAMVMLTVQVQITNPIPWLILYFSFIPAAISKPVTLKNLSRVDHKSHHDLINLAKLY